MHPLEALRDVLPAWATTTSSLRNNNHWDTLFQPSYLSGRSKPRTKHRPLKRTENKLVRYTIRKSEMAEVKRSDCSNWNREEGKQRH